MRPPAQYGEDITTAQDAEDAAQTLGPMMICTRLAGRAIIRVVGRCNDAQENENLDLSECQLMQVPDAVYHLMRHTDLKTCDLSGNVITKIPPKFTVNFNHITDLNLSHNQMSKLPDEIVDLGELQRLDISYNSYIALPSSIFKIPKLEQLNASNNHILEIEVEKIEGAPSLQILDVSHNPLTPTCHNKLSNVTKIRMVISPRQKEEWDDEEYDDDQV
ncbi:malignant fibrous histiocytoma-amplified sequence 1 homolog [Chrysoperla carnea]|uniref:malignant fibrous histiocytoma-amplified sequence 1 homolog n=1 Tax=Chrysoperla carnea TaxID=189513 RepID=UPI001D098024|nr:malignant fibrous histiocytoma-amplified sequence 1 homolog [Chrysoperla carnea]